jgi:predicted nuclease of predicted toxin-antitoxin system
MKILADEGVERPIVIRLRVEGHQVIYIAEVAAGSTDPEVLEIAFREQALLIAVDKDFGETPSANLRVTISRPPFTIQKTKISCW